MLPPFSRGGMVRRHSVRVGAVGAADVGRPGPGRLRRQHHAAGLAQSALAFQPGGDFLLARHHADRAGKCLVGHPDARHLVGHRAGPRELPVDEERLGVLVAQEAEARHDDGVAVLVRFDVDQFHRQHVAAPGALDVDGPGHRMNEVEVDGREVVGVGLEVEVGVQRVAGMKHDEVARIGPGDRLDGRMVAVEAVRVVGAMGARLFDLDDGLPLDVGGVGARRSAREHDAGDSGNGQERLGHGTLSPRDRS
jgi:hypothetical protein